MREIVVISGKGGTGKTSVSASFAHLMTNGIVCDLDVDAPDLHIVLQPEVLREHAFISGVEAAIRPENCIRCGKCFSLCRFEAIRQNEEGFEVDPLRCEGCGVCAAMCPSEAIELSDKHCGNWYESRSRFGSMIHARLFPGEENSGRLVSLLKQRAREQAAETGQDIILCDGSPGIGCPVISSLSGAHMAVAVVEPTPSGRHDFSRVADLCDHFRIPVSVLINKADLNRKESEKIALECSGRGYAVVGELPFGQDVTDAMILRRALTETDSPLGKIFAEAWEAVLAGLSEKTPRRSMGALKNTFAATSTVL